MRIPGFLVMLVAIALPVTAQQPAPADKSAGHAPAKAAGANAKPADPAAKAALHEAALEFAQASDVRQLVEQNLDKMLDEGKQAMLRPDSPFDPQFVDEWVKRMRARVNLDDFVQITANVYAAYFNIDELGELTRAQLGLKQGRIYSRSPQLNQKLKSNSARIQRDINTASSKLGSGLSAEVGQEIQKEHPEWVKSATTTGSAGAKS